mmetsp:Transcript_131852/g.253752  ORF Transcript_131852/g.253752 Transcript_131852/m.253752 type:complete len:225 (+) Transcript_131852:1972-2646(+)
MLTRKAPACTMNQTYTDRLTKPLAVPSSWVKRFGVEPDFLPFTSCEVAANNSTWEFLSDLMSLPCFNAFASTESLVESPIREFLIDDFSFERFERSSGFSTSLSSFSSSTTSSSSSARRLSCITRLSASCVMSMSWAPTPWRPKRSAKSFLASTSSEKVPASLIRPPSMTKMRSTLCRRCSWFVTNSTVLSFKILQIQVLKSVSPTCMSTAARGSSSSTRSASA